MSIMVSEMTAPCLHMLEAQFSVVVETLMGTKTTVLRWIIS